MPNGAAGRSLSNGRLNLEQQKKRAKELLRGLHGGDAAGSARLAAHHPKADRLKPETAQLADTQLVVARECGFDTWPKHHAEALKTAREAARRPDLAPDTPRTLHLRCGADIQASLARAGFTGAFQAFTDPFCQGPVKDEPRNAFIETRAAFIARAHQLYPDIALNRLRGEYGALDDLARHDRVVLWFEHDSYDQLILAFLLRSLGERHTPPVELICADRVPAVARFVGLGQLAPEVIRLLWDSREAVTTAHVSLGAKVWAAVADSSQLPLFEIARSGTPPVPPMARALLRHLQELPSARNGLSLTEQLALDLLAEHGPMTARRLFERLSREREPLPFLGDAMFWPLLEQLAGGGRPLIDAPPNDDDHHQAWPSWRVALTVHGDIVRSGRADWLGDAPSARWVGGVEIARDKPPWRWDETTARPVQAPAAGRRS